MERELIREYSQHSGELSSDWADKLPTLKARPRWYSIPILPNLKKLVIGLVYTDSRNLYISQSQPKISPIKTTRPANVKNW